MTTDDGYILEMHRIPSSPKLSHDNSTKTPVLVMHGLMESSAGWVIMGPEKGLGEYYWFRSIDVSFNYQMSHEYNILPGEESYRH